MSAPYELTENQKLFVHDAEVGNLEVDYEYSGRGMYGAVCPSVVVNCCSDFKTNARTSFDNMGLGFVVYAPS